MKDRRARLRPRDGARQLYYGANSKIPMGGTVNLPWNSGLPFALQSPVAPNLINSLANEVNGIATTAVNAVTGLVNNISGAINSASNVASNVKKITTNQGIQSIITSRTLSSGSTRSFDNVNILAPLAQTDGLVWPFTPTITMSEQVDYTAYDPVHTNQELHAYSRTRAPQIQVNGQMAVQNEQDAAYALACIHFLRTISKMSFGQSANPGTPPPILLFSAYGDYMYNDVPVIVQNFSIDFSDSVDYIQVPNTNTYVPAMFQIQVQMVVQNTPAKLRSFNLEQFRSGALLKQKGWL